MNFMNESIEASIEKLRHDYAEELEIPTTGLKRTFSISFKHAVVSQAETRHISVKQLASKLGLGISTITKWKHELGSAPVLKKNRQKKNLFQKLQIESEPDSQYQARQDAAPYLEGKSGVRIVGLSLKQMAELLRCL